MLNVRSAEIDLDLSILRDYPSSPRKANPIRSRPVPGAGIRKLLLEGTHLSFSLIGKDGSLFCQFLFVQFEISLKVIGIESTELKLVRFVAPLFIQRFPSTGWFVILSRIFIGCLQSLFAGDGQRAMDPGWAQANLTRRRLEWGVLPPTPSNRFAQFKLACLGKVCIWFVCTECGRPPCLFDNCAAAIGGSRLQFRKDFR